MSAPPQSYLRVGPVSEVNEFGRRTHAQIEDSATSGIKAGAIVQGISDQICCDLSVVRNGCSDGDEDLRPEVNLEALRKQGGVYL
jgi:hypothetical protein